MFSIVRLWPTLAISSSIIRSFTDSLGGFSSTVLRSITDPFRCPLYLSIAGVCSIGDVSEDVAVGEDITGVFIAGRFFFHFHPGAGFLGFATGATVGIVAPVKLQ